MSNLNADYKALPTVDDPTTKITTLTHTEAMAAANIGGATNQHDVIALVHLTSENADEVSTTSATTTSTTASPRPQRPTTPTPARKSLSAKKPKNLNLQIITSKYAETENATLSNTADSGNGSGGDSSSSSKNTNTTTAAAAAATTAATPSTTSATIFPHEQHKTIRKLDIGFENITFSAKTGFFKREIKDIINGLTGQFHNGELSAIVGPSGAGKSTLLNILSAYTPHGYNGEITINGNTRDTKAFKPNCAFIAQDTSMQPFLTVKEAMHFSANLKIGIHMTKNEKRERVRRILEAIGMYENRHTRTGHLSGGQKKRLAIALELVNNPPVLILDEPTSGLDSSTSYQCISLLKKLAMEGRTVICTIHQPSALTFEMFDHLYAIAEGQCIYTGGTKNLVPFLAEAGLDCPESYNPADYLMEIATHDYGNQNPKLVEKIQNGRNDSYRRQGRTAKKAQMEAVRKVDKMMAAGLMTPVTAPVLSPPILTSGPHYKYSVPANSAHHQQQQQPLSPINELSSVVWDSRGVLNEKDEAQQNTKEQSQRQQQIEEQEEESSSDGCCKPSSSSKRKQKQNPQQDPPNLCKRENIYATPFYRQLNILLLRTFLILWRDKSLTLMRFVIHFVTALLIGFLYYGIGNDAGNALNNFRYAFYTIMFIMYCAFSSILVKFPLEFPIVSREHFNRWYSLRAYYIAITLADIPIQFLCTSVFILITYVLTGQPWDLLRLTLFSFIVFLTALVGQSIGLAVGASLSVKLGAIFGPFFICPFLTFSGFFLQLKDAPVYLRWIFHASFLKYSLDGAMLALFGYDRPKLQCSSMYCHYSRPKIFLKDLDMANANYEFAAIFLISVFVVLRIVAFYIMSFRLRLFR